LGPNFPSLPNRSNESGTCLYAHEVVNGVDKVEGTKGREGTNMGSKGNKRKSVA
jgi:hypothetical protein